MREAHQEAIGWPEVTVRKILLAGPRWPTMTTNVKDLVRACDASHKTGKPGPQVYMPLTPRFKVKQGSWGIHFVGSLTRGARLVGAVVTATEYC